MNTVIRISARQIVQDLREGMTRYKHEDAGWGSIQEKYGMTPQEVERFFQHRLIKDVKTVPFRFQLIEDLELNVDQTSFAEDQFRRPDFDQQVGPTLLSRPQAQEINVAETVPPAGATPDYFHDL